MPSMVEEDNYLDLIFICGGKSELGREKTRRKKPLEKVDLIIFQVGYTYCKIIFTLCKFTYIRGRDLCSISHLHRLLLPAVCSTYSHQISRLITKQILIEGLLHNPTFKLGVSHDEDGGRGCSEWSSVTSCVVSPLFCLLKLGGRTAERSLLWTLAKDESFCHGQTSFL